MNNITIANNRTHLEYLRDTFEFASGDFYIETLDRDNTNIYLNIILNILKNQLFKKNCHYQINTKKLICKTDLENNVINLENDEISLQCKAHLKFNDFYGSICYISIYIFNKYNTLEHHCFIESERDKKIMNLLDVVIKNIILIGMKKH